MAVPSTRSRPDRAGRLPHRVAALIEQGLLSGANFLAFILLARTLSVEAWGGFGLAYGLVLFLQGFQRALVTIPMIPFAAGGAGWLPARAHWQGANTALALAAALLLAALATAWGGLRGGWVVAALWAAAAMAAPAMAHEFCRRAAIQEGRLDLLAGMGLAYACVLLAVAALPGLGPGLAVVGLGGIGQDLPPGAQPVLALVLASLAAAAVYRLGARLPVLAWPRPPPRDPAYLPYSGWALASHLAYSGYNFGVQALLGALAGPAALGAFHACRTLVQPVSTLQAAMDSIDKPRAAAALAKHGHDGLHRVVRRALLLAALLAAPYLAAVAWGAGPLLGALYGPLYAGQEAVVLMWCLAALCSVVSQPLESALYVSRRTGALFVARAVAALFSLALAPLLVRQLGAAGAPAAVALGFALAAVLAFVQLQRRQGLR
jgi:O-antigen/teichoic acid export membrane protein